MTTKLERQAMIAKIDQLTEKKAVKKSTVANIPCSDESGVVEALYIDIELIDRCLEILKDWIINDKCEY